MHPFRLALVLNALAQLTAQVRFTSVETGGSLRPDATDLERTLPPDFRDTLGVGEHSSTYLNDSVDGNGASWIGGDVIDAGPHALPTRCAG
jgi:hypothetical protein